MKPNKELGSEHAKKINKTPTNKKVLNPQNKGIRDKANSIRVVILQT